MERSEQPEQPGPDPQTRVVEFRGVLDHTALPLLPRKPRNPVKG